MTNIATPFSGGCACGAIRYEMDVWTSDAHPWDHMNPVLPKFEKYPQ